MPKRYFWLKFKEDFFNSDDIKVIMAQENGSEYVIFWMKLLLKSISGTEIGLLRYKENIPYTPELLSTVTDTNIDIVKGALTLFQKLGMIEIMENGDMWVEHANALVGSETDSAIRMRRLRGKKVDIVIEKASQSDTDVTECYVEKEIEKELEKDVKFNEFWSLYPKKIGKKEAKKIFFKLKPNDELFKIMIDALEKQKRWREEAKRLGQFVPEWKDPERWIKKERWADEIDVREEAECPF